MTKYDKQPKTILLENGGLLSEQCEAWIDLIDDQYVEINSEVSTYMRGDDLLLFAMFIHPNLRTIAQKQKVKNFISILVHLYN